MKHRREHIEIPEGSSFRLIAWNGSVEEVEVVLDDGGRRTVKGEGMHWHFHPEMELTWFAEGEGLRFVGDHIGSFAAGDLVLVGRRLPHHWQIRGRSAGLSVQWHYPEGHPLWSIPEMKPLAALFAQAAQGLVFAEPRAQEIGRRMQAMAELPRGSGRFGALIGIFAELAAGLAEARGLSGRSFTPPPENSPHSQAIREAVTHILAGFREPIPLESLLEVTEMSRATFCRQFRLHTGNSFSEFVNRVRLHAACRELRSTRKPVIDIALDCGISQVSFFNRVFRREIGCTPSEYRRKQAYAGAAAGAATGETTAGSS